MSTFQTQQISKLRVGHHPCMANFGLWVETRALWAEVGRAYQLRAFWQELPPGVRVREPAMGHMTGISTPPKKQVRTLLRAPSIDS